MNTRRIVYIAIFVALITLGGLVSVPIPFTQVEISLQTVFVITAGLVLGGVDGGAAVLVYIIMGLVGLPVFTRGGGIGYVFQPSFGYLIGFVLGAFVSGSLRSRLNAVTRVKVVLCGCVGLIPIYLIGATYQVLILYYYTGSTFAAAIGGLPAVGLLLIKDAALVGFVGVLYPTLHRAMRYR